MPQKKTKSRSLPVSPGRSPIHGTGLFATRAIRKDALIGVYRGKRTRRDGRYVLWLHAEEGGHGIDGRNELRFVNHSRRPNAVFHADELYARVDIRPGEEITHDYGTDWHDLHEPPERKRKVRTRAPERAEGRASRARTGHRPKSARGARETRR